MKITVSVIKADVGGIGGHTRPSEGLLDAVSYDGELLAVPLMFSTVVLVYNMDLFDQAGAAYPTQDWTWSDSLAAAKKISALGDDVWGMYNPIQFWEFYKVTQQNGGGLMTPDGKTFTINSKENVATLQYMLDRVYKHHVMPTRDEQADRPESDLFVIIGLAGDVQSHHAHGHNGPVVPSNLARQLNRTAI